MNAIYSRIDDLCKQNNTNVTAMCRELKIQRSSLSELKAGRAKNISADKIAKIANYFNVSALYITDGLTQSTNDPNNESTANGYITEEDIKFALFNGAENITDEMYEEVKRFAEFVKQRENK